MCRRRGNARRRGAPSERQDQAGYGRWPSEHVVTSLSMPLPVEPLDIYTSEETIMLQQLFLAEGEHVAVPFNYSICKT